MAEAVKYLDATGLKHYDDLVKADIAKKADKTALEATDAKVRALEEAGGEPNVIESVSVNGTKQTVTDKGVDITVPTTVAELTDASDYAKAADVPTTVAELTDAGDYAKAASIPTTVAELTDAGDYAKAASIPTTVAELTDSGDYALKTDVQSAVHYKGTVATYSALPSTNLVVGDLYNVEAADSEHGIDAGDNVVWNGSTWDVQAGTIDLSGYVQKSDIETLTNSEIDAIVAGE